MLTRVLIRVLLAGMKIGVLTKVLIGVLAEMLAGALSGNITSMHNLKYVIFTTMTLYELIKKDPYICIEQLLKKLYGKKKLKSTN